MKINGNIMVGQSGGPTAAINSSLAGVFVAGKKLCTGKVYGMVNGVEGLLKEKIVDMSEKLTTDADVELLKRTPSSYLGSCRYKLPKMGEGKETYDKLFEIFKKYDIKAFFYIGGNDSMDTVNKLSAYAAEIGNDIRFIGVPKTIDNDLTVTDHTPGFGSAAKFVATVTKEIVRDGLVYDMDSITVVEIMGRDAGWLTGASALAAGEDCEGPAMVLLPEVPVDYEYVKKRVAELTKEKKSFVIAVSEGIKMNGKYICELAADRGTDAFGHTMLTGTGAALANMLKADLGLKKIRAVELSSLQRCASHCASLTDITESFAVGEAAVKAASEGLTGKMALLKRVSDDPYLCVTDVHDVSEIANEAKSVPRSMINENGDHVTEEFLNYVRPLIQGEVSQLTVNGLPKHIKL